MDRSKLIVPALLLFFGLWLSLSSQQEKPVARQPYQKAIRTYENFVSQQMAFDQIPGISVGFIKDDFTWARGFGYADLENRVKAKPESSYRMASITKTFTAFAVLQLAESGKINLDAEIQSYVPYYPQKKWPITIRQLLGHLGGIPHYVDRDKELHYKTHMNTKEAVAIFQDYDLVAQPGTRYHYSSYGYNLLGAAIEEASGQPYGEFIKQHIFGPLGMSDSRMDDPTAVIPNRVRGYRWIEGHIAPSEFVDMSSRFAAGGTRSTVIDLLKYARGIIQGRLVSSRSWELMLSPMATDDGILTGRGMSWTVRPIRGHFQISHGGSQSETKTYLFLFPLEKFAVAIASNMETFDREYYAYKLAELVLEEDLDTPVYLTNKKEEPLYSACEQVFSYGLSYYLWQSRTMASSKNDLRDAFAFFNQNVAPAATRRDAQTTKDNIFVGIHPIAGQAFTKIGSFMAYQLGNAYGGDKLRNYHKTGPLSFFMDYLAVSQAFPPGQHDFRFTRRIRQMLSRWEKDWAGAAPDDTRCRQIPLDADFMKLSQTLSQAFSPSSLYPDFHENLLRVAQFHLKNNRSQQALSFLDLAHALYPNRIPPILALASLHLWMGNAREARRLFLEAQAKEPSHPGVSIDQFQRMARDLIRADKGNELSALAVIVTDLYPRSPGLFKGLGDMFYKLGQTDTALIYYKKALKLDHKRKDVRDKIKSLEKKEKK